MQLNIVGGWRRSMISDRHGLTLVEVLVAVGVSLALLATLLTFERFQLLAMQNQTQQLNLQSAARSILELVSRDVRRAGFDPSCSKAFGALTYATPDELRIQADLDSSGSIDQLGEDLTYRYESSTHGLERVTGGLTDILVEGVDLSRSGFRYLDGAGNELTPDPALTQAELGAVRRVRFELALGAAPRGGQGASPLTASVSTDVDIRNRFFAGSTACP